MEVHAPSTPKYLDPNQPGLEVGIDPSSSSHSGWPNASKPVWGASSEQIPKTTHERKILGLTVGVFWAVVVLLCVLVAGGVGGGLGAGLASRKSTCSSDLNNGTAVGQNAGVQTTTVTVSATNTAQSGSAPSSTDSSANPTVSPKPVTKCETDTTFNGTSITPLDASGDPIPLGSTPQQTFLVMCNTNWPGGAAYGNPGIHDIMKIYEPDLTHCVAACAEYNAGYQANTAAGINVGGGYCKGVSLVLAPGEFCYLKNGTGTNNTSTSGGNRIDSALLQ